MMNATVPTVTGPVDGDALGLTLPHEHLFNDLSAARDEPSYAFSAELVERPVSAAWAWALRHDPYCCADNLAAKSVEDVLAEMRAFAAIGGRTLVDVTSSPAIGRDPLRLRAVAERTGLNVIMGCGTYLEKFEGANITARTIDAQAAALGDDLDHGTTTHGIRPGVIGEIGVSPAFTPAERAALRAAALAQLDHADRPLMVHLPGWQRRAHQVLDLVLDEVGVRPDKVVLAHMDPSGGDVEYQRAVAARGVWLEFDMIGMDVTFPHEGAAPAAADTADAVAGLIRDGHAGRILLSHDLFLKQMWTRHGGNGLNYVPTVFAELLAGRGISSAILRRLLVDNPQAMLVR